MNKDQKLFTKKEILELGFKRKREGGYFYFIYDDQPKNPHNDVLITNDMLDGLSNPMFHINRLRGPEDLRLTREQVLEYINEPDENGNAKIYNPELFTG